MSITTSISAGSTGEGHAPGAEAGLDFKASPYAAARQAAAAKARRESGRRRGIDPTTGQYFDDTKRYVDALPISAEQRHAIYEGNARRVFPRLDAMLKARGL